MYIFGVSYSQNMVIFDEFRQTISTSIKLLFLNRGVQYTDFFMYKYIMLSSSTVLLAQCFEETYFLSLINCCNKMNISGPDLFSLFFKCRKIHSQNNNKHKNKLVFLVLDTFLAQKMVLNCQFGIIKYRHHMIQLSGLNFKKKFLKLLIFYTEIMMKKVFFKGAVHK